MGPGTQFTAPNGLGPLVRGVTYYVLATRAPPGWTLLAWFERGKEEWRAHLTRLERSIYETALCDGRLVPLKEQASLPPWLSHFEGIDVESKDLERRSRKSTFDEKCLKRYDEIKTLVKRHDAIVRAEDPVAEIHRIAHETGSKQKKCRLVLWYVVYQLFRRQLKALLPANGGIGKWKRDAKKHTGKKFGRPNETQGKLSGHSAIPLVEAIVASFYAFAKLTVPMTEIYAQAMVKRFGCRVRANERGIHAYYHPKGNPFPTFWQFYYWVVKELGLRTVQVRKLGRITYRNKKAVSEGSYSESVSDACEHTQTDAYFSKTVPTKLLSADPDLPLVTARLVCVATGQRLGIGGAYGNENSQAYRSMLFCAAIDKQRFGRIIGVPIKPGDFISEGLPLGIVADRGAGGTRKAGPAKTPELLPDRGMTPSFDPQSKGNIEASHRREVKVAGPPSYVQNSLTAIELLRREFLQAITDNKCSDVSSRLDPEMIADGVPGHPQAIYQWLVRRGRVQAYTIRFEDAVREFLEPVEFNLDSNGLWLLSQRYDSEQFRGSKLFQSASKGQRLKIRGFVLPLCVRTAWLEGGDALVEVDAQLRLRGDVEQLYMSLLELEQFDLRLRQTKAENRRQKPAARSAAAIEFEEQTGKTWEAGKRKSGKKPSRSSRRRSPVPSRRGHTRKR